MIRMLGIALLISGLFATHDAIAQAQCVTPYGSCPVAAGTQNGVACYCSSPNGTIAGQARTNGSAPGPAPLPAICCTAGGRIPFANASTPAGGVCTVPTVHGPATGQACY